GYLAQVHYLDQAGNPTPGKDGAFVKKREHDRLGRVGRSVSLWRDGRPMNDADGNAESRKSFDSAGNEVAEQYFDAAGRPIDGKMGWQRLTCEYDDHGNCVKPVLWH